MAHESDDLPTRLLKARDYVRDEVKPAYEKIGRSGLPALMLTINPALELADEALKEHDAVKMLQALKELEGIKL